LVQAQPEDWRELDNPGTRLLAALLESIASQPAISAAVLCEQWRETEQGAIISKLSNSALLAHIPPEGRAEELTGAIRRLNHEGLSTLRQRLFAKASTEGLSAAEQAQLRRALKRTA
jgi:Tfp pilus assembly ATPase PilU